MFKSYITYQELFLNFDIESWVDKSKAETALTTAGLTVASELRQNGIDTQRIYISKMFDDNTYGNYQSKSNYISNSLSIGNEKRMVVRVNSTTGCAVSLSGSNTDGYYQIIENIYGEPSVINIAKQGIHTIRFDDAYKYLKYEITGSASLFVYMVDDVFDNLIIYQAIMQIVFPLLGKDGKAESIYEKMDAKYEALMSAPIYDYDYDGDGTIEANEQDVVPRIRIRR